MMCEPDTDGIRVFGGIAMHGLRYAAAAWFLAVVVAASPASGQDWPKRPVTLVNLFSAGSGTDVMYRAMAVRLAEQFGQPFIVENRTGSGGAIGTVHVAKSTPDGYTILLTAIGPAVLNGLLHKSIPYSEADFEPIILISQAPQVIVSSPPLGFKTLHDLIEFGRRNPGKLNIGHSGPGTMGHLAASVFMSHAGIKGALIGYRGSTPLIQDLLGQQIQAGFPIYVPAVASVTALAVTSEHRASFLPNVPTARESGIDLVATTWIAVMAPKGTPKTIVMKLNAAINAYIKSSDGGARIATIGHQPLGGPPERLAQTMAADKAKWGAVVAAEKISLDPR
jgi:tripartite-type tricarboxylate transporter receptor subunit TctC